MLTLHSSIFEDIIHNASGNILPRKLKIGISYSSEANRETNNKRQKKHKPKKSSPPITAAVATPEESYDMMNTSVKNKSIMEDNVEDRSV